jgi:hypothetical protein
MTQKFQIDFEQDEEKLNATPSKPLLLSELHDLARLFAKWGVDECRRHGFNDEDGKNAFVGAIRRMMDEIEEKEKREDEEFEKLFGKKGES